MCDICDKVKPILEEITKGEGAYSMNKLVHCGNTVESMKALAKKALELMEG